MFESMWRKKEVPKQEEVEVPGQGEERSGELTWQELVANQKSVKPTITPEEMIQPDAPLIKAMERGYEGSSPFRRETLERVPDIHGGTEREFASQSQKEDQLEAMKKAIEEKRKEAA